MPLPGGATDKFGNRYEGLWTVACLADILDECADSIRLEPPGVEGEGVEFWLKKRHVREYHQVKRQHGASGRWTLAELAATGVLTHFWDKLNDTTAHCVFVSTHAAFQLNELADRACRSASWEEFQGAFLSSDKNNKDFETFRHYWEECAPDTAYGKLKRIRVQTVDEDFLRSTVENRLTTLVEGESSAVTDILAQLTLDKVHHELTAHDVWHHLENRDFRRRQWGNDPHVIAAVNAANDHYLTPLRDSAVNSQIIPRDEVEDILGTLTSQDESRGVLLAGEAGVGKSGVIFQVVYPTRTLSIIPEPHTVIFNKMCVRTFVLHFLDDGYRNFDETSPVKTTDKQAIEGEVRTVPESEKALNRRVPVEVLYLGFERKFDVGFQVGVVCSQRLPGYAGNLVPLFGT